MCGITGIYSSQPLSADMLSDVNRSVMSLFQRGPDCQRAVHLKNAILGHARLSIIDLSENATQPLTDCSGRYTIVFNGEFFNYREHRQRLENAGYRFKTQSDTEVFLALYAEMGDSCLDLINGFFAVAIYDSLNNTLFIARDRYGEKPLFYTIWQGNLIFTSELKAILSYPVPRKLNRSALYGYLLHNYIPDNSSMIEGIYKLQPGHKILASSKGIDVLEWYRLPLSKSSEVDLSKSSETLYQLLSDSVSLRLESDVPLGCFLSGGVDSSIIALLASNHKSDLLTFNIGFPDQPYFDETAWANRVSKHLKTNHHTFEIPQKQLVETVYDVIDNFDEPFADSSAIPVNLLSRETRKKVTVALSGDGADELFGGYRKHLAHSNAIKYKPYRKILKVGLPFLKVLPKSRNSAISDKIRQIEKFIHGINLTASERYLLWASISRPLELEELLIPPIVSEPYNHFAETLCKELAQEETLSNITRTDVKLVLHGDMLPKVDRMSMAQSLEVRPPFLDFRVVEFALSLPDHLKIRGTQRKIILKNTFAKYLPEEIFTRPKKGFEVPLAHWLQNDLADFIDARYLSKSFIESQGIFRYSTIEQMKKQLHSRQVGDVPAKLWAIVVFQHWFKKYNPY
ncbi:MAG TPA: asparagine synthase (glutamine-hydrolyzing) [Salinivirgaceae bacterium]|nr:asparagine synthase (glutamine-hydrolyzing) [Salinivirgaceae bacterium]